MVGARRAACGNLGGKNKQSACAGRHSFVAAGVSFYWWRQNSVNYCPHAGRRGHNVRHRRCGVGRLALRVSNALIFLAAAAAT
jgi:hypothetical protein